MNERSSLAGLVAILRNSVSADSRSDAQLLAAFLKGHDQESFKVIVGRHASLVYGVCRRTLGDDCEDAFQATFLVLIQRAKSVRWLDNFGPWLYGVAVRVARKARFRRDRRFVRERQVVILPEREAPRPAEPIPDETWRAFDEELFALPEVLRRAVVLCELQRVGRGDAARLLGIREGTLSSRLARARKRLRDRLGRRGVALSVPPAATVADGFIASAADSAGRFAFGASGVVPLAVTNLLKEVIKMSVVVKLKIGAVLLVLGLGLSCLTVSDAADGRSKAPEQRTPPAQAAVPEKVAKIFDQSISRDEFANYLIERHGAAEIERFVTMKILDAACARKGVVVTEKDVQRAFEEQMRELNVTAGEFETRLLPQYGKSLADYQRVVIRPRLQLTRLAKNDGPVTDGELREAFENKYGERRRIVFANWPKKATDRGEVERQLREVDFAILANRRSHPSPNGDHWFPRYSRSRDGQPFADAVYALKAVGFRTPVIETEEHYTVCQLVEITPPSGKRFEDVRDELTAEVRKDRQDALRTFNELREAAKPEFYVRPDPKPSINSTNWLWSLGSTVNAIPRIKEE